MDRILQLISTMGMSLPSFFSAILVAWVFGFLLHEYTSFDMTGSLYELDDYGESLNLKLKNLILLLLSLRTTITILSSGVKNDTFGKLDVLDE